MTTLILIAYMLICCVLLIYSIIEFSLLINYLFRSKRPIKRRWEELPMVTIQLPLYNETYVVERLIDSIIKINYPMDKLEIQVLDDSSDDTIQKAKQKVEEYQREGFDIQYIQRADRVGFKAGALDYGLKTAKGQFIAIFDADFIPRTDFLLKSIPYFENEKIGVVQSRWSYINENYSLLTKLQTVMLNTHFSVEQAGRNRSGAFINFNGTAGVWSRKCIDDAGGWHADTLTEDLDLSFRAQMKGWKFNYVIELDSPSELPITIPGYRDQQFRWSKGAAECARKNIPALWSSKSSFWAKLIGSFHLLNSSVFLIVLGFILLSMPLAFAMNQLNNDSWIYAAIPFLMVSNILLLLVFIGGNAKRMMNKPIEIIIFPVIFISFLVMNMGISLYMTIGVVEGYLGKKSAFVRTPKFNVTNSEKIKHKLKYNKFKFSLVNIFELVIIIYGSVQIVYCLYLGDVFGIVFASMFTLGVLLNFGSSLYYSFLNKNI